jgi:hypothetical protein
MPILTLFPPGVLMLFPPPPWWFEMVLLVFAFHCNYLLTECGPLSSK